MENRSIRRVLNSKQIEALKDLREQEVNSIKTSRYRLTETEWDNIRNLSAKHLDHIESYAYGKVLVYDIETSRVKAHVWGTGKTYIRHDQLVDGPEGQTRIISIAWKFVGEDKVYDLTWDDGDDKEMVRQFLEVYNNASLVVGQNNDNFDNKLINTMAAKYGFFVDRYVKSFDIYKMAKKYFRLPSYSMAFMAKFFGLTLKQSHEGTYMWLMIQEGTDEQKEEYLAKMVTYNRGDIVTTEELFMKLKPYFAAVSNKSVDDGNPKWGCPVSGSLEVELLKTIYTEAGTVQRILYCKESQHQFKVSNRTYIDFVQRKIK